jgi:hypothetical protein
MSVNFLYDRINGDEWKKSRIFTAIHRDHFGKVVHLDICATCFLKL